MIDQLRLYLAQLPRTAPVNVYVRDAQFPLTVGELIDALAVTDPPEAEAVQVVALGGLRVRELPGLTGKIKGRLPDGAIVAVAGSIIAGGYAWAQIQEAPDVALIKGWVAREFLKTIPPPPPQPLQRVRKVGWHISIGQTPDLNLFKTLHQAGTPIPTVMLVNRPDLIAPIKRFSPSTIIACRNYPDDHPGSDAQAWATRQIESMQVCLDAGADYLTLTNEWCAHEDQGLQDAIRQANWWMKAMDVAESKHVKITVLDLAAMHLIRPMTAPTLWSNVWKPVLVRAAERGNPVCYHCYTHPTSPYNARNMADHAMLRWVNWVSEIPTLKVFGGEFGAGKWSDDINHKGAEFMKMVRDFDAMVAEGRLTDCLLGVCAFTLGATPDWENFNFTGSLDEYARYMRDGG